MSKTRTTPRKKKTDTIETACNKHRTYFFRTYHEPVRALINLGGIYHYAYVCHDRDITPEGKPKKPHYHCVVTFGSPRSYENVEKLIRETIPEEEHNGNELHLEIVKKGEKDIAVRYLMHLDDPSKPPYERYEVKTDFDEYVDSAIGTDEPKEPQMNYDVNLKFMADLVDCNAFQMGLKYGRDYIKNVVRYDDFRMRLSADYVNSDHLNLEAKVYSNSELDEDSLRRLDIYRLEIRSSRLQAELDNLYRRCVEDNFKHLKFDIDRMNELLFSIQDKIEALRKDN